MPVNLSNISSIAPNATGTVTVTSDLDLVGTPAPVYRINGVPLATGGGVTSVFGRTGVVTAQNGDYTAAQITNAVSSVGSYADPGWITSLAWSKISGAPAGSQWTDIAGGGIYYNGGYVGIGTASPAFRLDVSDSIRIGVGSSNFAGVWYDSAWGAQRFFAGTDQSIDGWRLYTITPGVGNALVVSSSGNVGIGTGSPNARLQIDQPPGGNWSLFLNQPSITWNTAADFNAYRFIQTASNSSDGSVKGFAVGAGGVGIGYAPPIYGSTDALYVNGKVGIGTATPSHKFVVCADPGNVYSQVALHPNDGNTSYRLDIGYTLLAGDWRGSIQVFANDIEYPLLLNPWGGNVGIGISNWSPSQKLDVNGLVHLSADTSGISGIYYDNAWGGSRWFVGTDPGNDIWRIYTPVAGNLITVTSSGNVSIGTGCFSVGTTVVGDQISIVGLGANGYGQLRIVEGPYGSFWRQDSASLYLMTTNVNDPWGMWKAPFAFQVDLGSNTIGICASPNPSYGLSVGGNLNITGGYYVNGTLQTGGPTNRQDGGRAVNTVYQNQTGKPMWVLVVGGGNGWLLRSDQGNPPTAIMGAFLATGFTVTIVVLPGWYYMLDTQSLPGALNYWHEWW